MQITLATIAKAVGGRSIFATDCFIKSVSTDTRQLSPPSSHVLFVALRGPHYDGHHFIDAAAHLGVRCALVDEQGAAELATTHKDLSLCVVKDTQEALLALGAWYRQQHANKPVAGVTGSNGKTTTKELLAAALGAKGIVHKTPGNLNNHLGVPLTLLSWPQEAWICVLEMGMSGPGEIAKLTQTAQPEVGIITSVGLAHVGNPGLGSLQAIAAAKAELVAYMPQGSIAVLNADDAPLMQAAEVVAQGKRMVRFGRGADCDVQLLTADTTERGLHMTVALAGQTLACDLPLFGVHNAYNAMAAMAAAWTLGLTPSQIVSGLSQVALSAGRLQIISDLACGVVVVDDSYNANPSSMAAGFATFKTLANQARRVVVLGDMFELGDKAALLHHQVGRQAAQSGITHILAIGPHAAHTVEGAKAHGAHAVAYAKLELLLEALLQLIRPGDWLLIKGSHGMHLERIVAFLRGS